MHFGFGVNLCPAFWWESPQAAHGISKIQEEDVCFGVFALLLSFFVCWLPVRAKNMNKDGQIAVIEKVERYRNLLGWNHFCLERFTWKKWNENLWGFWWLVAWDYRELQACFVLGIQGSFALCVWIRGQRLKSPGYSFLFSCASFPALWIPAFLDSLPFLECWNPGHQCIFLEYCSIKVTSFPWEHQPVCVILRKPLILGLGPASKPLTELNFAR